MKENIEDISADIELQYGQPNMERNIAYVLSLVEAHATEDGRLDDDIPVPSIEAAAKTILLLIDRPELSWETICREQRVKHVMEYLFIRARNHPDEVHRFVDRLLKQYVPKMPSQMVRIYLNAWKHIAGQSRPTKFTDEILYPEHAEKILDTLHFLLQGKVGRGAALVMVCARDEGLVRDIAHAKIVTEFCLQQLPARAFPRQGEEPHRRNAPYQDWLHERGRRTHCFPARQTELQKCVPATVAHDEIAG